MEVAAFFMQLPAGEFAPLGAERGAKGLFRPFNYQSNPCSVRYASGFIFFCSKGELLN